MDYNLYIFASGSFLLLGFSIHMLFTNIGNTYLNKLLASMMLMRGLQMIYFIAVNTEQTLIVSVLFNSLGPFLFVFGAFLYLYVRGFIRDESRLQKKDLIHFMPFLFAFIDSIPWYLLDAATRADFISDMITHRAFFIKNTFVIFPYHTTSFIRNGLLLTYFILVWRIVLRSGIIKNRRNNPVLTNWILFFVVITTLSNLNLLVNSFINIFIGSTASNLFLSNFRVFIQSTILLGFLGYLFYNPKVLYGFVFVSKEYAVPGKLAVIETVDLKQEKELLENQQTEILTNSRKQTPTIHEEEIDRLKAQMISIMETEQPFLNPDFSLGDLAYQMSLPQHHCSYILNEYVGKNFREWVNEHRVNFFIEHYPSLINTQTIVSIALASGFKNKNTFYSAFEKVTGQKPSQYFSK
ncbi:helix-turn-helix domain-containing protein [Belliella sp. R4-6]|uniref:Helix-turn-helix domain-containing protein n=1 Tax=Belliella alkalica TaxID=1730871 RepID=A0ABS9V6H3_9BACT|nr:helix-turn-helix domain-containing protein [Belliella alkalica]MCH7412024.1 helix-turn-helix domain-containing protein [Belliella alkalica]